jgi:hypothetical protein
MTHDEWINSKGKRRHDASAAAFAFAFVLFWILLAVIGNSYSNSGYERAPYRHYEQGHRLTLQDGYWREP